MAKAGTTPGPAYKRGDNNLDYGDATALNAIGPLAPSPDIDENVLHQPQGEEEEFLFAPTNRPTEPITAGAPFGAGADLSKHAIETDADFEVRIAEQLSAAPGASSEVRNFAKRVLRGE